MSDDADMLSRIFALQAELNDYVFQNNGLKNSDGSTLCMSAISSAVNSGKEELAVFSLAP